MPDKKREEFFIDLYLRDYNSQTGKHYTIIARPEDDNSIPGTYDFLCEDKNSVGDYLAIEEKSLCKSTENVRDNVELAEIVSEVGRILVEKDRFYNKEYHFDLEFKTGPPLKERLEYANKIAEAVEEAIKRDMDPDMRNRLPLKVEGCDLLKKFYLLKTHKRPKVTFTFAPESNVSWDVQAETFQATCEVVENSNIKLNLPKQEGKKTILVITNYFILVDEENVRDAVDCLDDRSHQNIDEIIFINKRSFEPGYAINKIK